MNRSAFTMLELVVALTIVALLTAMIACGIARVRHSSQRAVCADRLRQVSLAMQNYHGVHGLLPPGISLVENGKPSPTPFMSWLTRLLPHIEQDALWQQTNEAYRKDRIFQNNPPHTVAAIPIALYACPTDPRAGQAGSVYVTKVQYAFTSYLGSLGTNDKRKDGLLFIDSRIRFAEVSDGLSQTLMAGERPPSADLTLGWWYAGWGQRRNGDADVVLGVRGRCNGKFSEDCGEGPFHFVRGSFENPCDAFHFWSPHGGGANFAFADGSVRFLSYSADPLMPALATRAGAESVAAP